MKPYYETENGKLYCCDIMSGLKQIHDKSVNCVITSPPYWQLRDYGFPEQWGLEPTFQEYLDHLWKMMDEIWRIMKDDGTAWINLGDTYGGANSRASNNGRAGFGNPREAIVNRGIDKCLMLIPHRFAIGCIDRGWIMRNDIIWAKRNGMPESVTDRFSKKHEYFFFMAKNKKYYFDLDEIRDKHSWKNKDNLKLVGKQCKTSGDSKADNINWIGRKREERYNKKGKNPGDVSDFWDIPTKPSKKNHFATYNTKLIDKCIISGCPEGGTILDPFNGTGTTTLRAQQLKRKWIGIDGKEEYCEIAKQRIEAEIAQLRFEF